MKKTKNNKIVFLLLATLSISSIACKNNGLNNLVLAINASCPIYTEGFGSMDNVTYDNNTVSLSYTLEEDVMHFDAIRANNEAFRNNMLISYVNTPSQDLKIMFDEIVKAKANLCMNFTNEYGDTLSLHFTYDELEATRAGENANPEALLKSYVDNARLQTPQLIDTGLIITDMTIDANYFTYVYSCDEAYCDIDYMNENMGLLKEELLSILDDNPWYQEIRDLLKATNRGLAYKYVGTSTDKTCTVLLEANEL